MKNYYEKDGDTARVFIKRGKEKVYQALIDSSDLDFLASINCEWRIKEPVKGYLYAYAIIESKFVLMHRLLLDAPRNLMVDHINHSTLDNRRKNLRLVTNAENQQNRKGAAKANKSSNVRGVTWDRRVKLWKIHVKRDGKKHYFGYAETIEDAARIAIEARRRLLPFSQEA